MIESYRISYLAVGRDLLRIGRQTITSPGPDLIMADPDFDLSNGSGSQVPPSRDRFQEISRFPDRRSLRFERLTGTAVEGRRVAALLRCQPRLQAEALEGTLKACRSPRILHLATHGFFLPDQSKAPAAGIDLPPGRLSPASPGMQNPLLRSGLALAGANTWLAEKPIPEQAEDGLLTAEDLASLDLLDTELAVLSACETGLGDIRVGEGVFGLRRAFAIAGVRTLIMSLWKVPDKQTQQLMSGFYERLLRGQSRSEALRNSQLELRKSYSDPFYWGAFVCQGDPGPMPSA